MRIFPSFSWLGKCDSRERSESEHQRRVAGATGLQSVVAHRSVFPNGAPLALRANRQHSLRSLLRLRLRCPVLRANHLRFFGRTGNGRKMRSFQKNIYSDGTSMSGAMQTESAMVEKFRIFPQKPTMDQLIILILWHHMHAYMMIRGSVVGF